MGTAEGMRAYSMDLRERVVAAVDGGMTQEQAAAIFGVSVNTVGPYLARRGDTGSLAPSVQRHGPKPEKKARLPAWLPARLQVAADATLAEHAAAFRYVLYKRTVEAALDLLRGTNDLPLGARLGTADGRAPLLDALIALELAAPKAIREQSLQLQEQVWQVLEGKVSVQHLAGKMDNLIAMLRDDLVPKRLR